MLQHSIILYHIASWIEIPNDDEYNNFRGDKKERNINMSERGSRLNEGILRRDTGEEIQDSHLPELNNCKNIESMTNASNPGH